MRQFLFLLPALALLPLGASGQSEWSGYPVEEGSWVNTESWFGWVNVAYQPWIYSDVLGSWGYMEEPAPEDAGGWLFVPAKTAPAGDESLLLHLPFDSAEAVDLSPGNSPVTVNGAGPGEGDFADAYWFNGSTDHVTVPDIAYGPYFTVSFWFNTDDISGTGYRYMFSHGMVHDNHSVNAYFIADSNFNEQNGNSTIKTTIVDTNDDGFPMFFTQKGLADGQWHLYSVSVHEEGMSVYVDGELVNTWQQGGDNINPTGVIAIGNRADVGEARAYKGYLDDVRLYNRDLSAEEIQSLHQDGR